MKANGDLSEQQLRVLARVAQQMVGRSSCDILIQLREGGVREYDESRKFKPADFESPADELAEDLRSLASYG